MGLWEVWEGFYRDYCGWRRLLLCCCNDENPPGLQRLIYKVGVPGKDQNKEDEI